MTPFSITMAACFIVGAPLLIALLVTRRRRRAAEAEAAAYKRMAEEDARAAEATRRAARMAGLRRAPLAARSTPPGSGHQTNRGSETACESNSASLMGLMSSSHSRDEDYRPAAPSYSSGYGGDFGGAGASGSWGSSCSSSGGSYDSGSSSSDSGSCSSSSSD